MYAGRVSAQRSNLVVVKLVVVKVVVVMAMAVMASSFVAVSTAAAEATVEVMPDLIASGGVRLSHAKLGGAAEGGLLVEGVRRVGEGRRLISAGLRLMNLWVKYDLRAALHGPAHGFWVAERFVTDGDPELQARDLEDAPTRSWDVGAFFAGVDLHLVLKAEAIALSVEHEHAGHDSAIDHALRTEHDCDAGRARGFAHA
jgi:hypothetical protein